MINARPELVIVGLGELATIACDAAGAAGNRVAAFLADDDRARSSAETYLGAPLTTLDGGHPTTDRSAERFLVAIGDNGSRRLWTRLLVERGSTATSLVHPFASRAASARLGQGVLICAAATIDPEVVLGDGVIIGSRVLICHETRIGPFSRLDRGVVIGGRCEIGEGCVIGEGAVVLSNVSVGRGVIIGPRTVVTKNIPDNATAEGVPARIKR
jgi:sugar O-acyltransferase (sialic acid O-acetyltransferase NeuD family)